MKDEYDFSKGERGKFYRANARLNLPVYLDADVLDYLSANPTSTIRPRISPIWGISTL